MCITVIRWRLLGWLPREGGNEDSVVVHQHERSILLYQDVVRFEVTMREGLGKKPGTHPTETVGETLKRVAVVQVVLEVSVKRDAFSPIQE